MSKYKTISFILGTILFTIIFMFFVDWSKKSENTSYKQELVYEYDYFKSDCQEYFYQNKILDRKTMESLFKKGIEENIAFEKEIDLYDKDKIYEERFVDLVCGELEVFSKKESQQVIYDIFYPSKDDLVTKDCDIRGCTYSN